MAASAPALSTSGKLSGATNVSSSASSSNALVASSVAVSAIGDDVNTSRHTANSSSTSSTSSSSSAAAAKAARSKSPSRPSAVPALNLASNAPFTVAQVRGEIVFFYHSLLIIIGYDYIYLKRLLRWRRQRKTTRDQRPLCRRHLVSGCS